ncbi:MAG: hypothetical protein RLZZ535_680, partial [Cyanobacteriota bacterium]
ELKIVLVRFDSNSPQSLALKFNLFIYLFMLDCSLLSHSTGL